MNFRRILGLFGGAAAGAAAVGAEVARAQDNSGGSIDIGGSIAETVTNAVSGISSGSSTGGSTITGSTSVEHNEAHFGEQEGVAIADASGGNSNLSFVS